MQHLRDQLQNKNQTHQAMIKNLALLKEVMQHENAEKNLLVRQNKKMKVKYQENHKELH